MIDSTDKKETDSTPDQDDQSLEDLLSSVETSGQDDLPPQGQGASDPGLPPSNVETAEAQDQNDKSLEEILKSESLVQEAMAEDPDPGSGLKRLTEMVASTSAADVKRGTRSAPPPASIPSQPAQISAPPQISTPPQQSKSKGLLLVVGGAALIAVVAAVAILFTKPENTQENEKLSAIKAQIDSIEKQRSSPVTPEPEVPQADTPPSEETPLANQEAEEEEAEEEEAEEEEAEPPTTVGKANRQPKRAVKKRQAPRKSSAPKQVKATSKPDDSAKTEPKKESQNIDDFLLGGSAGKEAKKPEPEAKAPPAPEINSSLPTKPTKAQVKAAMQQVTAKASKCSKYSTETVKVKLVVGGNGRVQSAAAQGAAAGTTAGKCVEMLARTAKFPEFSGPSFALVYPVVLK